MERAEEETNKTTTKGSFTYTVAPPESKSLADECKRLNLPGKGERDKDPLWDPMGMLSSRIPEPRLVTTISQDPSSGCRPAI